MLKKLIVAAMLVATAVPVLASDASDDAREGTSEARRGESGSDGRGDSRRESNAKVTDRATSEATCCDCRCAPNEAGYRSDPDPIPDYGG